VSPPVLIMIAMLSAAIATAFVMRRLKLRPPRPRSSWDYFTLKHFEDATDPEDRRYLRVMGLTFGVSMYISIVIIVIIAMVWPS
jgi:hypothetical protein